MRHLCAVTFLILCRAVAVGQPQIAVHEVPVLPSFDEHTFTFDTLIDTPSFQYWTVSGVKAIANQGSWFHLSDFSQDPDPNTGLYPPNVLAPGTSAVNKFASFVSQPRSQFANGRFTNSAVHGSTTSIAGAYDPANPAPLVTDHEFNVAWLALPPDPNQLKSNAAILRLTLLLPDRPDVTEVTVNGSGEVLATINLGLGASGNPALEYVNFTLNKAVPEPGTIALAALAAAVWLRRR